MHNRGCVITTDRRATQLKIKEWKGYYHVIVHIKTLKSDRGYQTANLTSGTFIDQAIEKSLIKATILLHVNISHLLRLRDPSTKINKAYILHQNHKEAKRLDAQHVFSLALAYGKLIQHGIPRSSLWTVANVGTGTGSWLRESSSRAFNTLFTDQVHKLNILGEWFLKDNINDVNFVLYNIVQPFP